MDNEKLYVIGDLPGFAPQIGRLVSMMNYVRHTTLQTVKNLSVDQLDYVHDEDSNSIGALLRHYAAVEKFYQVFTFEGRQLNEEEYREWGAALELGEQGRKELRGWTLERHMESMLQVREATLAEFRKRDDEWLMREQPFWGGKPANFHFMWFHVFEDEINHRGQMRWLVKRLPKL